MKEKDEKEVKEEDRDQETTKNTVSDPLTLSP